MSGFVWKLKNALIGGIINHEKLGCQVLFLFNLGYLQIYSTISACRLFIHIIFLTLEFQKWPPVIPEVP